MNNENNSEQSFQFNNGVVNNSQGYSNNQVGVNQQLNSNQNFNINNGQMVSNQQAVNPQASNNQQFINSQQSMPNQSSLNNQQFQSVNTVNNMGYTSNIGVNPNMNQQTNYNSQTNVNQGVNLQYNNTGTMNGQAMNINQEPIDSNRMQSIEEQLSKTSQYNPEDLMQEKITIPSSNEYEKNKSGLTFIIVLFIVLALVILFLPQLTKLIK